MKLFKFFIKSFIITVVLGVLTCGAYIFIKYGVPYLDSQSKYTQELPTIEKLNVTIDSLVMKQDSLLFVIKEQSNVIESQTDMISVLKEYVNQKNQSSAQSRSIYSKLQSMEKQLTDMTTKQPEDGE